MLDEMKVGLGQFIHGEIGVEVSPFQSIPDDLADEHERFMHLVVLLEARGKFARRGEGDGEAEAQQVGLAVGKAGHRHDDGGQLVNGGHVGWGWFRHAAGNSLAPGDHLYIPRAVDL